MSSSATASVLLLDAGYQPLGTLSLRQAVKLLVKERAVVLEEDDEAIWLPEQRRKDLPSATEEFRSPSVIRLLNMITYGKKRGVKFSRMNVWIRDRQCCCYCGVKLPLDDVTYDHVKPRSQGGTRCFENIVSACYSCNARKGARSLAESGMKLLVKPVRPTSLPPPPPVARLRLTGSIPDAWKQYLRDELYWNDSMVED